MNAKKRQIWEVDPDYCRYKAEHYPEAIEFIRKNVDNFRTENAVKDKSEIWIDVNEYSVFSDLAPDGSFLRGADKVILFRKIVFHVFPRKIKPEYVMPYNENISENKYITWDTATKDIQSQKDGGYAGERWVLKCRLEMRVGERTKIIPGKTVWMENPEYVAYFKSPAYLKYQNDHSEYEQKFQTYSAFRKRFHVFSLPDGSTKSVLLYNRPEEKFVMLRNLGVSESEIQKYRHILADKPTEPVPPPKPSPKIWGVMPSRRVREKVWIWKHVVESMELTDQKKAKKSQSCQAALRMR